MPHSTFSIEEDEINPLPSTRLVTVSFTMLGVMVLFPWNCILSVTNFFVKLFPGHDWPLYSTQVYQTAQMPVQVIMIFCGASLKPWLQFVFPLQMVCFCTAVIVIGATWLDSDDLRLIVILLALGVLSASLAMMQASLFGAAAKGIEQYGALPAFLITGMGVAGLISMGLALSASFLFPAPEAGFLLLFGAIIFLSLLSMRQYKVFQRVQSTPAMSDTAREPLDTQADQVWSTWRSVYAGLSYELAIFCNFAITFMVFPAVTARWSGSGIIPSKHYITFVIGDFQIMDTVGRVAAERIEILQKIGSPIPLWTLIVARVSFIPLFFQCANGQGIFVQEAFQLVLMALFAFSNGFLTSLAMQFAPVHVPAPARSTVGMAMTLMLVAGMVSGSYLATLPAKLTAAL